MRLDEHIRLSRLLDIYGSLLTERQRIVLSQYVNEDMSLYEIGELTQISRQGVRDALVKAEAKLESYEQKLSLLEKTDIINYALSAIDEQTADLSEDVRKKIAQHTSRIAECVNFDQED